MRAELRRLKRDTDSSQHTLVAAADDETQLAQGSAPVDTSGATMADCVRRWRMLLGSRRLRGRTGFPWKTAALVFVVLAAIVAAGLVLAFGPSQEVE